MHLKRYRRPTVKDALRAVREDLGPDALVLSTRVVAAPGVRGLMGAREIEVTAAAERQVVSADRHAIADASPEALRYAEGLRRPEGLRHTEALRQLEQSREEVAAERALDRAAREISARLRASGLDADLADDLAAAHPVARRRGARAEDLRETLAKGLAPLAAGTEPYASVEVFVGPPGVGKTTTIAKIAAQERATHGRRLSMVAADGFRVGAVEQLRLYADILGSNFGVARTPDDLSRALDDTRRPLLLDTAGRSPSDDVSRDMFRVLASRRDVRTHLVMPATTPAGTAQRLIDRFADARPGRVVLTRLDEADSIGPLVKVFRDAGLPLSYFGTGQNVPDDLQRATPTALAGWIVGDAMRQGAVA